MSIEINHKTKTARLTDLAGNIRWIPYSEGLWLLKMGKAVLA